MNENATPQIHRAPPHSVEAEQGVLGSMLVSPREGIAECADKIDATYFFVPSHQTIFDQLVDLWKAGAAIDVITFTQILRDKNLLETVGGAPAVTSLYTFVPTAANLSFYLDILIDKYTLRSIIAAATLAVHRAYEEQAEAHDILEQYQVSAIEIGNERNADKTSGPLSKYVPGALDEILWHFKNRGKCAGISTGFVDLDRTMNGFEKGKRPYCFAARPAMGKSALMLAFADNIAIAAAAQRKRIKIFSVEMTARSLAKRMIAARGDIDLKNARFGFRDDEAPDRAKRAAEELMTDYIDIDEKGDLNIVELVSRARRAVIRDKCDVIMIDYLQRLHGASKRSRDNRQIEIAEITQGIAELSKSLGVPIVVLAQLNRNAEERKDGKPELGDLRESGAIEQEMGFVGLLWRASYYCENDPDKRERMMKSVGIDDEDEFDQYAECIVAKQNEGPVGSVPMRFVKKFARYEPQDPDRPLFSSSAARRQQSAQNGAEQKQSPLVQDALDVFKGTIVDNGK
jgi:replicative DNA helicase